MKLRIVAFTFFLFQAFALLAQDMNTLKSEALRSYKAGINMNYEDIFDTTYPKVFDIVSKDQMKEMFGQMMDNEQFSIKLIESDPKFLFGEIKKIEDKLFCVLTYNNVMEMTFKVPMEDPEGMLDVFKVNMGAEKVTYNKLTSTFKIELRSTLIAVADSLTNNKWKFLNKDNENKMFSMIFNDKIQKQLGL
ncbi:hypothetical protein ACFSX9_05375 [Flavobacterium ardleyense]|uniref:DUF4468 domain-containing protein n=1 Tax=Flavobacterium ardleyense TaxID=2038737 RepID=A0ABW5Z8P7_9FLAO